MKKPLSFPVHEGIVDPLSKDENLYDKKDSIRKESTFELKKELSSVDLMMEAIKNRAHFYKGTTPPGGEKIEDCEILVPKATFWRCKYPGKGPTLCFKLVILEHEHKANYLLRVSIHKGTIRPDEEAKLLRANYPEQFKLIEEYVKGFVEFLHSSTGP